MLRTKLHDRTTETKHQIVLRISLIYPLILANQFDFTTVANGASGQLHVGLMLQLFPMETIVTSDLIGVYLVFCHDVI